MTDISLTIAIYTVNRAYCLGRAIESVLNQSCNNIEILILNNASTDNTKEVIRKYSDQRIRVFHQEKLISPSEHGRFGMMQARGRYMLNLSDDDWLEQDFAKGVLDDIDINDDVTMVYTGGWVHGEKNVTKVLPNGPMIEDGIEFMVNYWFGKRKTMWCGTIFRTSILKEICDCIIGKSMGDIPIILNMAARGKVCCVNSPLTHYTWNRNSGSFRLSPVVTAREQIDATEYIINQLREKGMTNDIIDRIRLLGKKRACHDAASRLFMNACVGIQKNIIWLNTVKCIELFKYDLPFSLPRILAALVLPPNLALRARNWKFQEHM